MTGRIHRSLAAIALASLALVSSARAQLHDPRALEADPATADHAIAPRLGGLGVHHLGVTTAVPESQYFFDQGLRLTYGFNHSEALRAFKEAIRLDPDNAMAYWGWALVLGPNLNLPMIPEVNAQAYAAAQIAASLKDKVSTREQAYIDAIVQRYSDDPDADRSALDQAYADAMGALAAAYPGDTDAATLYAAALMNLAPWDYWQPDGTPYDRTRVLLGELERALRLNPDHPGALHYYIHAVEAVEPRRAEPAADRLLELAPGAGHLVHMPAHIYMRIGRYADSYAANYLASLADEGYIAQCRAQGIYPLGYYPHNLHFLVWSGLFLGRSDAALSAARKVAAQTEAGPAAFAWGFGETFLSQPLYVMVRFGLWDEILASPAPDEKALFATGIWHYARTLAYLGTGQKRRAARERRALERIRESNAFADYQESFPGAADLLTIAHEVVSGETDRADGRMSEALAHFERATRLEDAMPYTEPPDWYFPVRHYLGAALLEAGYGNEAEVIYWEDLRKNPDNGFSLLGLVQSLEMQDRADEAQVYRDKFESAWQQADVVLTTSRY